MPPVHIVGALRANDAAKHTMRAWGYRGTYKSRAYLFFGAFDFLM